MKRLLSPATNPTGWMSALGAVYAVVVMIVNARAHHQVIDPQVIVAALGAFLSALTRQIVTPTASPRDGNGLPLATAPPKDGGP